MWLLVGLLLAQGLGPVLRGVTIGAVPGAPANPNPSTLATNISLTPTLTCTTPGATTVDIKLDTVNPPVTQVVTGAGSCSYAATLSAGTQYFWQAIVHNSAGTTTGAVWSFTTGSAPGAPNTPSPANAATGQVVSTSLGWSDTGGTTFDVKFGTVTPPVTTVATGIPALSYTPGGLANGTTYYWQIVAHNAFGNATGPIWSFTTGSLPATPNTPSPTNGLTNVATSTTLTCVSSGATTYDVAFGTSSPPPTVAAGLASCSYTPTLANNVQYFWQITAHNSFGQAVGPIWSFTTVPVPSGLFDISNLTYLGSFRVPQDGALGGGYSGQGLTYNPTHNSLYINCDGPGSCGMSSGFLFGQAEISIPGQATWSKSTDYTTYPVATYLQNPADLYAPGSAASFVATLDPTGNCVASHDAGATYQFNGTTLIMLGWGYYQTCPLTDYVWTHSNTLATNGVTGPWHIFDTSSSGYTDHWIIPIPSSWQTALGGDIGVGQGCTATISQVSGGPAFYSLFTSSLSGLAAHSTIAANKLISYTVDSAGNDVLGNYFTAGLYFGQGCQVGGGAIPSNFRSILFVGINSPPANNTSIPNALNLNPWPCYGPAAHCPQCNNTDGNPVTIADNGKPSGDGTFPYCYDPANVAQGTHAYPYSYYLWAYDLNDLAAVKSGTKQANQLVPYAVWSLPYSIAPSGYTQYGNPSGPFSAKAWGNGGVAWDDTNHLLYVAQTNTDANNGPVVNVYRVQ